MVTAKKTATAKVKTAEPSVRASPKSGVDMAPAPKPVAARKTTAATSAPQQDKPLTAEQRTHYVEVAAFYIAEQRGFAAGSPLDDWLAAEAEFDRLMATGEPGQAQALAPASST